MSRKRHYVYVALPWSSVGLMCCSCCGKKITEGQYRYFETEEAYVPQHRACCEDDPEWKQLDKEQAIREQQRSDMLADAIAFRDKWGVTDLNELIEELK